MYIFVNALKNLGRNSGRNVLIAAIIFAIISTTVVALIINNTSNAVIDSYQEQFASEVTIAPDFDKVREQAEASMSEGGRMSMRIPQLTPEQQLAFMKSDALKESIAYASTSANSEQMIALDQDETNNQSGGPGSGGMISSGGPGGGGGASVMFGGGGNYRVYGDYFQDFEEGNRALIDGGSVMPAARNEALISSDLADSNNLKLGDTITLTSTMRIDLDEEFDLDGKVDGDIITVNGTDYTLNIFDEAFIIASREVSYDLKIVGIYDDLTDEYPDPNMPKLSALNRRNEVLTTFETLVDLLEDNEEGIQVQATYYLKSPDQLDKFASDVRGMGLSDVFTVSTNSALYEQTVKPVQSMKNLSLAFMTVVIVLGSIILILLTSISIRERKYEIGVLRAMGMKKGKVALGLWTELLVITVVCLVLGIATGSLVAQPITNMLITQQINAQQGDSTTDPMGGPTMAGGPQGGRGMMVYGGAAGGPGTRIVGGGEPAQPLTEMDVSLSLVTLAEITLLALVLASIAGLVSISRITKYEPIKILMERN
jgi:putative ABC transport system permease protein